PTAEVLARYGSGQQRGVPGEFEWKLVMENWAHGRSKFRFDLLAMRALRCNGEAVSPSHARSGKYLDQGAPKGVS
ncbi:MAG: hypothetical protein ACYCPM_08545, partial [Acidobacteriaceae bacterium]